jgi:hypothetical protein
LFVSFLVYESPVPLNDEGCLGDGDGDVALGNDPEVDALVADPGRDGEQIGVGGAVETGPHRRAEGHEAQRHHKKLNAKRKWKEKGEKGEKDRIAPLNSPSSET